MRTERRQIVFIKSVLTGTVHHPGSHIVPQAIFDYAAQFGLNRTIVHRGINLDPVVEIAGHPIGRANEITFAAAASVTEDKDTRMLQITVDNAPDLDILTQARDTRNDRAVSAYQHAQLHSGRRGFIQPADNLVVGNVVDFAQDISFPAGLRMGDVITSIAGRDTKTNEDVAAALQGLAGAPAEVVFQRDGHEKTVRRAVA